MTPPVYGQAGLQLMLTDSTDSLRVIMVINWMMVVMLLGRLSRMNFPGMGGPAPALPRALASVACERHFADYHVPCYLLPPGKMPAT